MGINLPEDVVTYLADNISANIREIEGALLSLNANVSYMNRRISTSLAKEVLKAYVHMSQKEISINRITEIVCKYFEIDEQSFNSSKRTREVAQARQIAMYLAKQHTKLPLAAIGSAIGGRNHATVLHSCKNVTNLIETDKVVKSQIEEIEKIILAG
jgi:chromosomal replication initiator protein